MICKECGEEFESLRSLHAHIKKHNLHQPEYYCKHYPRYSIWYKRQLEFKNRDDYFLSYFVNDEELREWEKHANPAEVKEKSLELLRDRIVQKQYQYAPFYNELITCRLPSVDTYKKHYGSYCAVCRALNVKPLYDGLPPQEFLQNGDFRDLPILIDTREQDPLPFKNKAVEKLFVGDYLLNDGSYNYTFVDRKSEGDFLGTLCSGIERFEREVEKAVGLDGYLFVVIESSIDKIQSNHQKFCRKTSLAYVFHNMRALCHKYPRRIQFVFSGNRENSTKLIPKLLHYGKELWNVDVQYFLEKEGEN